MLTSRNKIYLASLFGGKLTNLATEVSTDTTHPYNTNIHGLANFMSVPLANLLGSD
jgi:hypothetical protein